jgi:redox-sensitive bicupin YhaK (pirin superfamily)
MAAALHLKGRETDLGGGLVVRRMLPAPQKQAVGPFVFFDHFGPVVQQPGDNFDVRPHPHIGLATVTYLFDGAMMHRDSLGSVQRIEPGAINWMTAGSGIVHSERTPEDLRGVAHRVHGLQLWAALPRDAEEVDAEFAHTAASDIPELTRDGAAIRVLIGAAWGARSPVQTFTRTLYLDIDAPPGTRLALPVDGDEQAIYCIDRAVEIDGEPVAAQTMAVLVPGSANELVCPAGARVVVIGGEPLDGHRHMWWNFVSSSRERIEAAKAEWRAQRMGAIPGETEFIPLPER